MSTSETKEGNVHRMSIGRSLGLLCTVLWAPRTQMGLQTAVGIFFASPFIWLRDWTWSSACYAATLVAVGSLLVSQNTHLGGRLLAAATLVGPSNVGYILGGVLASIAKSISPTALNTVVLCVLSSLGLMAITCIRAAKAAPVQGAGILLNLAFGIVMMRGQFTIPIDLFWREVVGRYMLNNLLAAGCLSLAGALVVPSLAGSQLQRSVATIMRIVGDQVTACAHEMQNEARLSSAADDIDSQVCKQRLAKQLQEEEAMDWMWELEKATAPPEPHHQQYKQQVSKSLARLSGALDGLARPSHPPGRGTGAPRALSPIPAGQQREQVEDAEQEQAALEAADAVGGAPNGAATGAEVARQAAKGVRDAVGAAADAADAAVQEKKQARQEWQSAASLRPRLQQAEKLIPSADKEPPFLQPQRLDLSQWQDVISALQALITRVASLESALRGPDAVELSRRRIKWLFGNDTTAVLSGACGHVAGACNDLADAICVPNWWWSGNSGRCCAVFGPGWKGVRADLLRDTRKAIETYRCRVRQLATDGGPVLMMPYGEMRAMMYMSTMSLGMVDSMDALEQAVVMALVGRRRGTCPEAGGSGSEQQAAENGGSSSSSSSGGNSNGGDGGGGRSGINGGGGDGAPALDIEEAVRHGAGWDRGGHAGSSSSSSSSLSGSHADGARGVVTPGSMTGSMTSRLPATRSAAHSARPPGSTWASRWESVRRRVAFQCGWLLGLAKVAVIPVDVLQFWWDLYTVKVPATLRSLRGKQKKSATSTTTQLGGQKNATYTNDNDNNNNNDNGCDNNDNTNDINHDNNDGDNDDNQGTRAEKDSNDKRRKGNDGDSQALEEEEEQEEESDPGQQQQQQQGREQRQGDGGGIDGEVTGTGAVAAAADAGAAWRRLLSDRVMQYWAKIWLAFTVTLCGVLALQAVFDIDKWNPFFAYVAMVVAMDRKVETTLTKALLRVVGSWVGGTLGFAAMTNSSLANSPYGLAVLCCTVAFAMGLTGTGPHYKLTGMLIVTVFNAVVLCQYTACPPCTTGEFQYYIAQPVSGRLPGGVGQQPAAALVRE